MQDKDFLLILTLSLVKRKESIEKKTKTEDPLQIKGRRGI